AQGCRRSTGSFFSFLFLGWVCRREVLSGRCQAFQTKGIGRGARKAETGKPEERSARHGQSVERRTRRLRPLAQKSEPVRKRGVFSASIQPTRRGTGRESE